MDLSNLIRLLENGFELQQFFYLLFNAWSYFWPKNSRTWHGRSRDKSGTGRVRYVNLMAYLKLKFKAVMLEVMVLRGSYIDNGNQRIKLIA